MTEEGLWKLVASKKSSKITSKLLEKKRSSESGFFLFIAWESKDNENDNEVTFWFKKNFSSSLDNCWCTSISWLRYRNRNSKEGVRDQGWDDSFPKNAQTSGVKKTTKEVLRKRMFRPFDWKAALKINVRNEIRRNRQVRRCFREEIWWYLLQSQWKTDC